MNNGAWILVGAFVCISASWIGLVERPQSVLSSQDVAETFDGKPYPNTPAGQVRYGAEIYRKNGCAYCHTQQVRGTDSDVPRWGIRRTVAEDYAYEDPIFPGSVRIGPDLSNVGVRLPDANWHYLHLYDPKAVVEKSVMPPYRYLFEEKPVGDSPSANALVFPEGFGPEEGIEVVPTADVENLVAYLLDLEATANLEVAPYAIEEESTEEPAADPNAAQTPPPDYE